jgi:tRNA (cmo5U34)-methyltransferase
MGQFDWDPATYMEVIRSEVPDYERLQAETVAATGGIVAETILELGTGTGETSRRILAAHPGAHLHGIDSSREMLEVARSALAGHDVELELAAIEDPLPPGPFDLVVSALAVHHLEAPAKGSLFRRVAAALVSGGRFVLADVVIPENAADAVTPIDDGYDKPDTAAHQLRWLADAGLEPTLAWTRRDLAVLTGDRAR